MHELLGYDGGHDKLVDTALTARIESQIHHLKTHDCTKTRFFPLENIAENGSLSNFYTGFISYEILLTFFEFLGRAVSLFLGTLQKLFLENGETREGHEPTTTDFQCH